MTVRYFRSRNNPHSYISLYMRLLHYLPSLDRTSGGTTAYMQLLAAELGKLAELHIVTHPSPNPVPVANARVHYVSPSLLGGMKRQWRRLLDDVRPDFVHVNGCWMPQCVLAQRWAQQAGYKVVLSPHGMLEPWIMSRHYWTRKLPALWLYQKRAVVLADYLHATAESEKDNLLRLGYNAKIAVIPNGIEVEGVEMKPSWKRTGKILFLSRIHVKKGINFLIEAFAALKELSTGYELLVAGEGEQAYVAELEQLAMRLGVNDRVHFVGGVYGDEKWRLFREADVFVLPTYSENFGIVVAEALACGTPVITTKGTPWQELETCSCGWWTEVGTQGTVRALSSFFQKSEAELEVMGRNGRLLVEAKYSSRKMAEDMMRLYAKVK